MNLQVDVERVLLAHKAVRAELLAERAERGQWVGHTASSPFATAAAISALVIAHRRDTDDTLRENARGDGQVIEQLVQGDLSELLLESVHWLARHQNPDGGWGDCDSARSNIAATMLVQAAFRLTGVPAKYADLGDRADEYVDSQGGVAGLRRSHGKNKSLVAAILTNCALAGTVPWRQVPTLPFERLCIPQRWQSYVQLPYPRFAKATLLAVGRAKYHHDPPRNPITRLLRRSICAKSLALLETLQAADESFLASTSLTAFIVMSLASVGHQEHPIVQRGIEFLLTSVRGDACWPIVTDLATTNTAFALSSMIERDVAVPTINSTSERLTPYDSMWEDTARPNDTVAAAMVDVRDRPVAADDNANHASDNESPFNEHCLDWLLDGQRKGSDPLTEVAPGGWAWSDAPGALPNTRDTAAAVIALVRWPLLDDHRRNRIDRAVRQGVQWLLDMHHADGGWPTFYRNEGIYQVDANGSDVTAQALRALAVWRNEWQLPRQNNASSDSATLSERVKIAMDRGWRYLESQQRDDGSFIPLWFGNEYQSDESNPVVGTSQVLFACADLKRLDTEQARRAANWLVSAQHSGGGWGPPRAPLDYSNAEKDGFRAWRGNESMAKLCSVEETSLAVTALLPMVDQSLAISRAVSAGVTWLASAVEQDAHRRPAVIGFYPCKLWYHERLYPLVFAAGALSPVVRQLASQPHETAPVG